MTSIDFAAILCSRLCHDLVSPVGAIANGIEILADESDPDIRQQVIDLLEHSAEQTSNRLQFFRLAFGAAGGYGDMLDLREAHKAVSSFFGSERITLDWEPESKAVHKRAVKMLLNLALIAGEGLIRGGTITVRVIDNPDGSLTITIEGTGERFLFSEAMEKVLIEGVDEGDLDPRSAPAHLAGSVVRDSGGTITSKRLETGIRFVATLPAEQEA